MRLIGVGSHSAHPGPLSPPLLVRTRGTIFALPACAGGFSARFELILESAVETRRTRRAQRENPGFLLSVSIHLPGECRAGFVRGSSGCFVLLAHFVAIPNAEFRMIKAGPKVNPDRPATALATLGFPGWLAPPRPNREDRRRRPGCPGERKAEPFYFVMFGKGWG